MFLIFNIRAREINMSRQIDISLMFLGHIILSDVKVQTHHNALFLLCFSSIHYFYRDMNTPVYCVSKNYGQTAELKRTRVGCAVRGRFQQHSADLSFYSS